MWVGIVRWFIWCVLYEVVKKWEMCYLDFKKIECGIWWYFYDDIIVVVVYLDYDLVSNGSSVYILYYIFVKGGVDKFF